MIMITQKYVTYVCTYARIMYVPIEPAHGSPFSGIPIEFIRRQVAQKKSCFRVCHGKTLNHPINNIIDRFNVADMY